MLQRLLFILMILSVSATAMAQNVMTPADPCYKYDKTAPLGSLTNPSTPNPNEMKKWVHDPSQNAAGRAATGANPDTIGSHGFDQSTYKCYIYGNQAFRIRFPNNYDPANAAKYPLVLFLHGGGEVADTAKANNAGDLPKTFLNRENQDHLYWGAQLFEQRMNAGEWNGFLLFPQLLKNSGQWDTANTLIPVTNILDTLEKYNAFDPDRLIVMGLSAGGIGTLNFAAGFPKRVATSVTSCPENVQNFASASKVTNLLQIPIWLGAGGQDLGPDPANIFQTRDAIAGGGGNIYTSYYAEQGHVMWSYQWNAVDINNKLILSSYWNNASKAQPVLYFQNNQFCAGQPISAKMALTPGFAAYEWQYDGGSGFTIISGASSNVYTATQAGSYRVHFKRTAAGVWSAWTPNPVLINTKACSTDTAYAEHFDETPNTFYTVFGSGSDVSPYTHLNVTCQNGLYINGTETFSQDASGRQGGRFIFYNTFGGTSCVYHTGEQVWRLNNPVTVTPNTNYTFSYYVGNHSSNTQGSVTTPVASLTPTINDAPLTPMNVQTTLSGNISWKKCSFFWNSGSNTTAQFAILDSTTNVSGNNFVLDEISLVKYKAPIMPANAFKNVSLWAKANSIKTTNGYPVGLWTNENINGNNLQQPLAGSQPSLKNNAADNINFNPVVSFDVATNKYMQLTNGLSGTNSHAAVSAYVVTKFKNLAQTSTVLTESQAVGGLAINGETSGAMTWYAGVGSPASISTTSGVIDINKPALWTFSKNNNGTGISAGKTQDIRKNSIVLQSGTSTTTFTGDGSNLFTGFVSSTSTLNASIAEIIYILDSNITARTQNRIESYLALKYGTSLGTVSSPVNYTASDSTTVFWTGDAKFQNDVFGIGTDSLSGLVQKISNSANSGSGDGTGQSGKGNLVLSTDSTLLDKRFLMIGNSGASLAQVPIVSSNVLLNGSTRVGRNWKVNNTNTVGKINLSFDTTGLGPQAGGNAINRYSLLISPAGDTTYSGAVTFFTATGVAGKQIIFSGATLTNNAAFTIITNNVNISLPAVWLGFTAVAVDGNGVLNWKTSDEINVDRYTVEHSTNGVSFATVGSVVANNNSGVNQYNFTHTGLAAGIHYYRIRRTDKDGKSELSDTKSIKITTTGANVQVRPNPIIGSTLVLAISAEQSSKTLIQVMGVDGKMITQQNVNLATGNNLVNINISTVPPGIYLVRVQLDDEMVTKKFIKQHN